MNYPHHSIIVCLAAVLTASCAGAPEEVSDDKPAVVDVFACSDYCSGPAEQYRKRVYAGVSDAGECQELGGQPYTYVGWAEHTVCVAE